MSPQLKQQKEERWMLDILEQHDPGRSQREATEALAKSKEMEQRISDKGVTLDRIPIRGGYILTNRPHQWEVLRDKSSSEATLIERDVEVMKRQSKRSIAASKAYNEKHPRKRKIHSHIEETILEKE